MNRQFLPSFHCRQRVVVLALTVGLFIAPAIVVRVRAEAPRTLAAAVESFVEREELAGAVMLVADKDKVLAVETVGWADIAARAPMRPDSLFWIASQSKPMTATAVLMLVDEGRVKLDDPVEKYLPEFKGQMVVVEKDDEHVLLRRPQRPVQIRDLLSHTAGMPFKTAIEEPTLDLFPLAARVRAYAVTPLDSEPGSKYHYSNAGINTAGRIIEVVTGVSFEEFLDRRLCQPLGMKDTTFWPTEEQLSRLAKSYGPGPDKRSLKETTISQLHYPLSDRTVRFPMPAGGLFATAHDLARFYRMLLNGGQLDGKRVLSETAIREMTTAHTPSGKKTGYGYGFDFTETSFGHNGAYGTASSAHPASGLVLVWLVQHSGFPGEGGKSRPAFQQAALAKFSPAP